MRIDKFLKNSRIIKRRQVAKNACLNERVKINGDIAKAGTNVNPGDIIEVSFGKRNLKVKVLDLIDGAKKNDAGEMFEVIDE
ncbi:RNA-binding S4 domain-containing protein [Anaerococcus hydrogenalis]|uniref:RQC P-site tRNA stabilizing factor n=1 Tax=Anaerococcus hydrogenalis TaxID=33029 RepID=A0A2N6UKJ3_9FIRM|nr:RNA-binding S4 domain-containing protein [Anaerococcus hydrogenalis]MDK7694253.1 RNA-binding S4 domain-containing protein [Anaerococcus hydrogenalis]MDK7696031.1 RNA-binding S4 domain-containing protein [Anaerococcus hydrogenalis]MDK7707280.1 RNA-binding S4 domain-containing protein [Anaerococcus hydrogenalis]PMC82306.1 RNA-binding protein [Anaerococcus hydrogenalis]